MSDVPVTPKTSTSTLVVRKDVPVGAQLAPDGTPYRHQAGDNPMSIMSPEDRRHLQRNEMLGWAFFMSVLPVVSAWNYTGGWGLVLPALLLSARMYRDIVYKKENGRAPPTARARRRI